MLSTASIHPKMKISDLVNEHQPLIPWLLDQKWDFSNHGDKSLEDFCHAFQLDTGSTMDLFLDLEQNPTSQTFETFPLIPVENISDLVSYILRRFHDGHRALFMEIQETLPKVVAHHHADFPQLDELQSVVVTLVNDVEPHMQKEEHILFPIILSKFGNSNEKAFHAGSFDPTAPMSCMRREHDHAVHLLEQMSTLTDNFRVPPEACNSFTALYHQLKLFNQELRLHIHMENNMLFPRVEALVAAGG